jgi:hypothetical protein
MVVFLLEITDWDEGEKSVWSVHSSLESAKKRKDELMNDDELDIAWKIIPMEVKN